jgi:hypothetical protein
LHPGLSGQDVADVLGAVAGIRNCLV